MALTAEIADGWLPVFYVPEKANDFFGKALAEGQAHGRTGAQAHRYGSFLFRDACARAPVRQCACAPS